MRCRPTRCAASTDRMAPRSSAADRTSSPDRDRPRALRGGRTAAARTAAYLRKRRSEQWRAQAGRAWISHDNAAVRRDTLIDFFRDLITIRGEFLVFDDGYKRRGHSYEET